jgi:hypothetical protein
MECVNQLPSLRRALLAGIRQSSARRQSRSRGKKFSLSDFGLSWLRTSRFELPGIDFLGADLLQNFRVDPSMLPDVENLQVKAKGTELAQQRLDKVFR